MTVDRSGGDDRRVLAAEVVSGWTSELGACDGYVVLVNDLQGREALYALGPYTGLAALEAADRVGSLVDATVQVVRFHTGRSQHTRTPT